MIQQPIGRGLEGDLLLLGKSRQSFVNRCADLDILGGLALRMTMLVEAQYKAPDVLQGISRVFPLDPVTITKQGRPTAVVLSLDEYKRMGGERARLKRVVSDLRQEAEESGLTEEIVQAIIDEG